MFERPYLKLVKARIEEPRKFIQVILGPRQVGKTTMVIQLLSQLSIPNLHESADAISATNSAWLVQVWESARLRLKASGATDFLLVIDEIQKIDNWSEIVKQQWDKDTRESINIKVILLGSSRLININVICIFSLVYYNQNRSFQIADFFCFFAVEINNKRKPSY